MASRSCSSGLGGRYSRMFSASISMKNNGGGSGANADRDDRSCTGGGGGGSAAAVLLCPTICYGTSLLSLSLFHFQKVLHLLKLCNAEEERITSARFKFAS